MRRVVRPLIFFACVLAALALLVRFNATAREVIGEGVRLLFTLFTTPFILESSIAIIGLLILITWNQHRLQKDGDGWVEMEVPAKPKSEAEDDPKTL